MAATVKPPVWFWIVGALLLLWGISGVVGFAMDPAVSHSTAGLHDDFDRQFYASRPIWTLVAYAVGTIAGLIGTTALLLRRRDAPAWYVASLVAVVLLFGYMLGFTSLIAVKGFATAAGFPIVILVLCLVEIALARHAAARGWIG